MRLQAQAPARVLQAGSNAQGGVVCLCRAIRTETDQAHIVCYDKRLLTTPYGQRLLQGLPPFTQLRRD